MEQQGPAYPEEDVHQVHARVNDLTLSLGFEETPSEKEFRRAWERSHNRWTRAQEAEEKEGKGDQEGPAGPSTL